MTDEKPGSKEETPKQLLEKLKQDQPEIWEELHKDPALEGDLLGNPAALKKLIFQRSQTIIRIGEHHSAKELIALNKEVPGYIETHQRMVAKEQDNTFRLNNKGMNYTLTERLAGQVFAFLLLIFCISLGTYCVFNDHEVFGSALIGLNFVGITGVFITKKWQDDKARDKDGDKPESSEK